MISSIFLSKGLPYLQDSTINNKANIKGEFFMNQIVQSLFNLSLTPRWPGHRTIFRDTTATHSFRVTMLTMVSSLIKKKRDGADINVEKATLKALFHDFNEENIGPIKHKTKKSKEVEGIIEKLEKEQAKSIMTKFPEELQEEFYEYVVEGEDDSKEGKLVDLMDSFDALLFCHREILNSGSKFFEQTYEQIKEEILKKEENDIALEFIQYLEDEDSGMYNFFESILDLDNIYRWSGKHNTFVDDVSSHTFRMAALSALLCKYEDSKTFEAQLENDTLLVIGKIMFHDIPETIYGDVKGPIKNSSLEISEAFEALEKSVSENICNWVPVEIRDEIEEYLIRAKDLNTKEGIYTDILDKLDALNKALLELSRGNSSYKRVFTKILKEIKELYGHVYIVNYYYGDVLLELQIEWIFE